MPISSFRDPSGFVLSKGDRIFRVVRREEAENLLDFLKSESGKGLLDQGELIASRYASERDSGCLLDEVSDRVAKWGGAAPAVLEHDFIWFPSYPYEWPSSMLRDAARVTLDIAQQLLANGYGLKDATPYNVLFRGPNAVFVDAMSIEKRDPADPIWRPLGQFVQTFLYPLILEHATGVHTCETLLGRREGISADEVYERLSLWQRIRHPRWIALPHFLNRRQAESQSYKQRPAEPEVAQAMLRSMFRSLQSAIAGTQRAARESTWNGYSTGCHYDDASRARKHAFVSDALSRFENGRVLDLGANDGEYSLAAAAAGHQTVACDLDAACMDVLWAKAKGLNAQVLPLVVNIANPSPAGGWGNQETLSFLRRARGAQFDCVLMLALLHHLTVTERVPLSFVVDLAADLTTKYVVLEWVGPGDRYYQRLLRGRDELHKSDTRDAFEAECSRRFTIVKKEPLLEGRRWIYLLIRNPGS